MNPGHIIEMASAFYESCTLFAAVDAGIFGALAKRGGQNSDSVAAALGLNGRGCRLLLDACVALGLLRKENERYFNTPEASVFLAPGSPADLSGALRYNRDVYSAWGRLLDFARSGKPVERPEIHLGADAERTRDFVLAMHSRAMGIGRVVLEHLDLGDCRTLLDVGGGPGAYSTLIAQRHGAMRCRVIDLPEVVKVAAELISSNPAHDRVKLIPGDYHTTEFPDNNDAVLFFGVLHQESPDAILALFKRAWKALRSGGRVFVLDMMTDATHTAPRFSALFALNMALTTNNGWVFSSAELRGWLEAAGFSGFTCRPIPPPVPHWLASARKP
jgi:ubiquinone/menaquinone biosynthesis C-methylase UbiE